MMVDVKNKKINVYISGEGESCILLLSGSGVSFPKLEYFSLVNELSSHSKVIVIEKFGYGFSDMIDDNRDIDSVVDEYRRVLQQLGINTPVILMAHSMGFIEAMRWSQLYPDEISELIGLDPATPDCYKDFDIEKALEGLRYMAKESNIRKEYIESALDQIKNEFNFSADELREYKDMLDRNLANKVWISEAENLRDSIALVGNGGSSQIPALFFISNGEGTTLDCEVWRNHALNYLKNIKTAEYKLFDYPHNLYKFAPKEIADEVNKFIFKYI